MSARRHALAFGLVMAAISHTGLAQTDAAEALVEQGVYWEAQRDYDRADEAWKKLLLVVPNHARAWYGLGMTAIARGDVTSARDYLDKLKRQDPRGRYVAPLEQSIALEGGNGPALVAEARKLNDQGEWDKAIAKLNQALGNKPPVGDFALEYYRYLSNTKNGWTATKQGLERLQREMPGDPRVPLALAMLYIRNEATRTEGIQMMAKLTQVKPVSGYAEEGWRMALTWISPASPDSAALYEAYLKTHPDDAEIRKLLADSRKARTEQARAASAAASASAGPTTPPENVAGFKALEKGDRASAEADFTARLKKQPNDPDALGGLGVIRMQQGNLTEAKDLLTRATRQKGGAAWNAPLAEINSLDLVDQANAAQRAGNTAQARQILERAIKANPRSTLAENALAGIEVDAGNYASAEKIYRRVLARSKNDPTALAGLVGVLAATDRADQARQMMDKISAAQIGADQLQNVQAAYAKGVARAAIRRGDDAGARQALEVAMSNDRENPWIRLELAQLYLKDGRVKEATGLVDGLLITKPNDPTALYASASIAAARQDYAGALATLDRIPVKDRTANILALQRQTWLQAQIAQATRLAKQGRKAESIALLQQIEPMVENNVTMVGAEASAYVDAGDPQRGMRLLRQVMSGPNGKDAEVQLQYASILLKTNQDVEASGVLTELGKRNLSGDLRTWYSDLVFTYSVRQAEALRERGQLAAAYDRLAPLLQQRPDDPLANGLLARLYAAAGENAKAMEVAKRLVQRNPDNVETQLSAAQIATQARDYSFADTAIQTAMTLAPNDAEVIASAAGIYRQQGKSGKAEGLYERAIALDGAGKPGAAASGSVATIGTNPTAYAQGASSANMLAVSPGASPSGVATSAIDSSATAQGAGGVATVDATTGQPVPYPSQATETASVPASVTAGAAAAAAAAPRQAPALRPVGPAIAAAPAVAPGEAAKSNSPFASPVVTPTEPFPASVPPPPAADTSPKSMLVALDEIRQDRAPEILVGAQYRARNGSSGTSQLSDTETPIEIRLPAGDGKIVAQVTPVWLNSGALASDYYSRAGFGGGPVSALAQIDGLSPSPGTQSANGLGLAIGYRMQGITIDAGVTPLGFQYSNFTGGLKFDGTLDANNTVSYALNISSRPVTDSLLSFAGMKDSATGLTWGGVMASGVRGQLGKDLGGYGFTGWASWYSLNGHNVADNSRSELGLGWYWNLRKTDDYQLTTGLNAFGIWYQKNLSNFTYGQGGYFSPQQYYALMVPLTWAQRQDRFSYLLRGALGVQTYTTNDSNLFPTSSSLQAGAEDAMGIAAARGLVAPGTQAVYAGQTVTNMAYNLAAAGEYQVAPQLFLGGTAELNNASNYRQWGAGLYLRFSFYPINRPMVIPVSPYVSPYGQ